MSKIWERAIYTPAIVADKEKTNLTVRYQKQYFLVSTAYMFVVASIKPMDITAALRSKFLHRINTGTVCTFSKVQICVWLQALSKCISVN